MSIVYTVVGFFLFLAIVSGVVMIHANPLFHPNTRDNMVLDVAHKMAALSCAVSLAAATILVIWAGTPHFVG